MAGGVGRPSRSGSQPSRRCRCGAVIASDHRDALCGACQRRDGSQDAPPEVPDEFWDTADMLEALASRHIGRVIRAFRRHPYHRRPFAQEAVGRWLQKTQPQVCRLEKGPMVQSLDQLCFIARRLRVPAELLWFELPGPTPGTPPQTSVMAAVQADGDAAVLDAPSTDVAGMRPSSTDAQELLAGTFVAADPSGRPLGGVARIARMIDDGAASHRDADLVDYLDRHLVQCTAEDAARGSRAALPLTLGLVAGIELVARRSAETVRRDVLATGAHAAEFVGWLYRDLAAPRLADHWHDRAMEWAQMGGDLAMQGYVLLKKAQAAWDQRDTFRMLSLAEAARDGPWRLPPWVRAEALQQEARAQAMLGGSPAAVDTRLQDAAEVLSAAPSGPGGPAQAGGHYGSPLLALQTAICHREAGHPDQAVELYETNLRPEWFSRRDFGYFRALMAFALADAEEPDEACEIGMESLVIAMDTGSARTIGELRRLRARLDPWDHRMAVQELGRALPALTGSQ